jgi:galactokinase
MTGGGFGGCTVNLVEADAMGEFEAKIGEAYRQKFAVDPQIFECLPSDGAGPIFF